MICIENLSKDMCEVVSKTESEDCIIISINEVNGALANIASNKHIKDVLYLRFDDLTKLQVKQIKKPSRDYTLFNLDFAKQIKDFSDKWVNKGINKIIVHCAAGVSRSGAVACTLSRYYNGSDISYFSKGCVYPNELVYELMCKALDLNFNLKELKRLKRYSAKVASSKFRMNKGYIELC